MIGLSVIFLASQNKAAPAPVSVSYNILSRVKGVPIPRVVEFACEEVPVSNFDVRERLDRELLVNTYWQSSTVQLFKLASRYLPEIEAILRENGIPDDFKYMALAESGLRNGLSPSNAAGFWQILPHSGKELGLEVNAVVDERYHAGLSTGAACKYLKKAHDEFGSWTLAAASYNMGRARMRKVMREQQVSSYYDLFLNDETSRYVFRIIALKLIFENPAEYGFQIEPDHLYDPIPTRTIHINHNVDNLAAFALENGTNYKTLKIFNPWLRQPYLKVKRGKTYEIKLPVSQEHFQSAVVKN
jgi:hypothetical protein